MATKRAIVVGVNTYLDTDIPDLTGACNDAEEIRNVLIQHGDFEIPEENYLIERQATYASVMNRISDLLWKTDPCDLALIYFSGHGFRDSYGTGYVAPHDMIKDKPLVHGIQMQALKELALRSLNKRQVMMILDCCYSGVAADAREKKVPAAVESLDDCFLDLDDAGKRDSSATGTIVFSSSASDEASRERPHSRHRLGSSDPHPHGEFTFHLLEGLAGGAHTNEDGWISATALVEFVNQNLKVPNQKTKLFGANMGNLHNLVIARATQHVEIAGKLESIDARMRSGLSHELIFAAQDLSKVLDGCPNLPEAKTRRERVDEELRKCQTRARRWLLINSGDLLRQVREPYRKLEAEVKQLSFDNLSGASSSGLVFALLRAVDGELDKKELLQYLSDYEVELSAKPPTVKNQGRNAP